MTVNLFNTVVLNLFMSKKPHCFQQIFPIWGCEGFARCLWVDKS